MSWGCKIGDTAGVLALSRLPDRYRPPIGACRVPPTDARRNQPQAKLRPYYDGELMPAPPTRACRRRGGCGSYLEVPELLLPAPLVPELLLPGVVVELPEGLVVLPDPALPELLPYCLMQLSRWLPVRPTHWLGSAVEPAALEPEEPVVPDGPPVPEVPPAPEPPIDVPPGEVLEPELPDELCARLTLAMPNSAAATAAVSVFIIIMVSLEE